MLVKSVTSYGPKAGLELVTQHSKLIEDFKFNFLDLWIASYSSLSWRKTIKHITTTEADSEKTQ